MGRPAPAGVNKPLPGSLIEADATSLCSPGERVDLLRPRIAVAQLRNPRLVGAMLELSHDALEGQHLEDRAVGQALAADRFVFGDGTPRRHSPVQIASGYNNLEPKARRAAEQDVAG